MVPTFLQKRRTNGHSLRVLLALASLFILAVFYSVTISVVIADRSFTKLGKLSLIAGLLSTALMALGLVDRLRR